MFPRDGACIFSRPLPLYGVCRPRGSCSRVALTALEVFLVAVLLSLVPRCRGACFVRFPMLLGFGRWLAGDTNYLGTGGSSALTCFCCAMGDRMNTLHVSGLVVMFHYVLFGFADGGPTRAFCSMDLWCVLAGLHHGWGNRGHFRKQVIEDIFSSFI